MAGLISVLLTITVGLAGGLAVGTGFVAFLTAIGIVPRLVQVTKTHNFLKLYESGIIIGAVFWTWFGLRDYHVHLPQDVSIVVGLLGGMFIGLLAAALTEVLNVLPIIAKRIHIVDKILWLLMAMVFGKIVGSLFHWIFFVNFS